MSLSYYKIVRNFSIEIPKLTFLIFQENYTAKNIHRRCYFVLSPFCHINIPYYCVLYIGNITSNLMLAKVGQVSERIVQEDSQWGAVYLHCSPVS